MDPTIGVPCEGPSIHITGAVNRCSHPSTKELHGRRYCTRHFNIHTRINRIDAWLQDEQVHCPEHPDRRVMIQSTDKLVYCSAKTGEHTVQAPGPRGSIHQYIHITRPDFCGWNLLIPPTIWNAPAT